MIKRKKKICKRCGTEHYLFGKGLCQICYKIVNSTSINKKSDKKKEEDKQYLKLNRQYLNEHPFCEVNLDGCTLKATEVHHTKGRGKYYLDVNFFKAVCNHCHFIITEDSKDAIQKGHSHSRLKN